MRQLLDITTWARKDHYQFFGTFDEPFFGICTEVDCTSVYAKSKERDVSFFLLYLHASLVAANLVEPFRYRIINEDVWVYDQIHASPTINRPDGTFGFGYLDYEEDFEVFRINAGIEITRVQNSTGLEPALSGENVIHYSSLPWIHFSSVSHARNMARKDSIPKITFGKMIDRSGRKFMPVAVHVHHGLMDGWHVGQFVTLFQQHLNL